MGASSHTHFTDWERIVQERDTCEVPGNWCSMGEMDRWCDTEDCRQNSQILLSQNFTPLR